MALSLTTTMSPRRGVTSSRQRDKRDVASQGGCWTVIVGVRS
jgi:hypothetical protein